MFIDGSYRENKDWCNIVVPFWNCTATNERENPKALEGEGGEREEKSSGDGVSDSYALH
jgi:hypothetical protein